MFSLDPRLANDCFEVTDLHLCKVLLMNDSQYPWLILVPRVEQVTEVIQLDEQQQRLLWQESALISKCLQNCFAPDKLNIAALGNMVPQLHLHHIARFKQDAAWPKPVWGVNPAKAYSAEQGEDIMHKLKHYLGERK